MNNNDQDKPQTESWDINRYIILAIGIFIIIIANFFVDSIYLLYVVCGGEGTGCESSIGTTLFFIVAGILEFILLLVLVKPKK